MAVVDRPRGRTRAYAVAAERLARLEAAAAFDLSADSDPIPAFLRPESGPAAGDGPAERDGERAARARAATNPWPYTGNPWGLPTSQPQIRWTSPSLPRRSPRVQPGSPLPEPFSPWQPQPSPSPSPSPVPEPFANPGLQSFTSPQLGLQPQPSPREESNDCQKGKVPKRKRGQCRQGYFRETPDGRTKFTTWSTRKCQPSKSKRR